MKHRFRNMIFTSIKRRKKDISRVSLVAFLAAFFVMVTLLFQDNVDSYQQRENRQNYGDWFLCETTNGSASADYLSSHAYFDKCGIMLTGPQILVGGATTYTLGTADDTMQDIGNIRLREGKMPVNDNEIVMQLNLLANLGLGSNIGQTVTLSYKDSSGKQITKDYILSGILVDYTDNWINGSTLPAALVSKQCFDEINVLSSKNYMYHLKSTVKLNNESKYVDGLSKTVNEKLVFNQYAYEQGIWGDTNAYKEIIIVLVCMSICAIAYTYFSYISKRKTEYYRLRCFGVGKRQLKKLIIYEGMYACIPAAVAGFITALSASMILVYILKLIYHTSYFFNLKVMSLFICIASVLVTILISITLVTLLVNDKHIYVNTLKIPLKKLKRIKPKRLNRRNVFRKFHKREWKLYPLRMLLSIVLSVAVTVFILLCVDKVHRYYETGYGYIVNAKDFIINVQAANVQVKFNEGVNPNSTVTYSTSKQVYSHTHIFSQDFYDSLNSIDGIRSAYYYAINNSNDITWDSIENSPVRAKQLTQFPNLTTVSDENIYAYATAFYPDAKTVYESYKDNIDPQYYDPDAFERGEQVIYSAVMDSINSDTDTANTIQENTLSIGDKITYHTETGDIQATVVAMVNSKIGHSLLNVNSKYEYDFLASQSLGEKIATADNTQFGYNQLTLNVSSVVSFDGTNKRLTNLLNDYKLKFNNKYEEKAQRRNAFNQKLFIFSMMIAIVFSIYVVIYANMIATGMKYKKYNMKLLKNLGLSNRKLAWMEIKRCIWDNLWILLAVPLFYIISWYNIYKYLGSIPWMGIVDPDTKERTLDKFKGATDALSKTTISTTYIICITAIVFIILLLVAIVPIVKYIRNMNKEN